MCLSVCQHGTWSRVITWMVDCHGMVNGADLLLKNSTPPGGLEPPTFRLTAERANRLRHRDSTFEGHVKNKDPHDRLNQVLGVITG